MTASYPQGVTTSNRRSSSTTWEYRLVKIVRPPNGQPTEPPKGAELRPAQPAGPLARRNPRSPLTVMLRFNGGAAATIWVGARGRSWRFDGDTSIVDVVMALNEGDEWANRAKDAERATKRLRRQQP